MVLLGRLFTHELNSREHKRLEKHLKLASFPEYKPLEAFDLSEQPSLSQKQFNQLKELHWLEQAYNLIILGPPGVGKTLLSIGLGIEAIRQGYKVQFVSMDEVIHLLKTQEITRVSRLGFKERIKFNLKRLFHKVEFKHKKVFEIHLAMGCPCKIGRFRTKFTHKYNITN